VTVVTSYGTVTATHAVSSMTTFSPMCAAATQDLQVIFDHNNTHMFVFIIKSVLGRLARVELLVGLGQTNFSCAQLKVFLSHWMPCTLQCHAVPQYTTFFPL